MKEIEKCYFDTPVDIIDFEEITDHLSKYGNHFNHISSETLEALRDGKVLFMENNGHSHFLILADFEDMYPEEEVE